jgi:integrase
MSTGPSGRSRLIAASVSVGYERQVTRCKTANSPSRTLPNHTRVDRHVARLAGLVNRLARRRGPEWLYPADDGGATHPPAFSQTFDRIVRRAGLLPTRLHTHACLLIKNGVPLKVVSERRGHAKASFTMDCERSLRTVLHA